jgi:integral membrane protein
VRAAGLVEGVSFLLLLCVAMPLKYFAGRPEAVFVVGWAHGVLFVLYAVVAFYAAGIGKLSRKGLLLAAVASLVPLGPFLIDGRLKREEQDGPPGPRPA